MYEQNPMVGPGAAGFWNHTLEILLLLLGAFILGYLLRFAISRMQVETLDSDLESERRHRRVLEADFDRVRAEHSAMGSRISTLEGDLNRERVQLAESHQKLAHSSGQITSLNAELASLEGQLERTRTELGAENGETAKIAKIVLLNSEITQLRAALQECSEKTRSFSENGIKNTESDMPLGAQRAQASRLENLSNDLIGARTELSAARAGRDAMQVEIDRLHGALDAQRLQAKASHKSDDLKLIEGIGPKINALLLAAGIGSFAELSKTPIEQLQTLLADAGDRYRSLDPSTWPQQAKLCANGQWDVLRELQDQLSTGRNN